MLLRFLAPLEKAKALRRPQSSIQFPINVLPSSLGSLFFPMRFLVSHLASPPFVLHAVEALREADMLGRYALCLVNQEDALWQRAACTAAKAVRFDLKGQLRRRTLPDSIPREMIRTHPIPELARLAVSKVDKGKITTDRVFHWGRDNFDSWVARTCLDGMQGVYSYEYTCRDTFREARKRGMRTIYDVPSPEHDFVYRILDAEMEKFPELLTDYDRYCRRLQAERTQYRRDEYDNADVVIAASSFTRDSFAASGWPNEKVKIVPYGAPPVDPRGVDGGTKGKGPMRFLWAGTFSIRKGAHYLLAAWRKLNPSPAVAQLDVYGAMTLPERLLQNLPSNVALAPTVSRAELYEKYRQADMLMFPTLCDGFGMVATEAWAQGLPVLTTKAAGACDFLEHEKNGLLVPPGDEDALVEALDWCLRNPEALRAMREPSLQTADSWQWEDFRRALREAVGVPVEARV